MTVGWLDDSRNLSGGAGPACCGAPRLRTAWNERGGEPASPALCPSRRSGPDQSPAYNRLVVGDGRAVDREPFGSTARKGPFWSECPPMTHDVRARPRPRSPGITSLGNLGRLSFVPWYCSGVGPGLDRRFTLGGPLMGLPFSLFARISAVVCARFLEQFPETRRVWSGCGGGPGRRNRRAIENREPAGSFCRDRAQPAGVLVVRVSTPNDPERPEPRPLGGSRRAPFTDALLHSPICVPVAEAAPGDRPRLCPQRSPSGTTAIAE